MSWAIYDVVSGWEEREKRGTMHVKKEKKDADLTEALGWSSGCPDSGIAPPCFSSICRKTNVGTTSRTDAGPCWIAKVNKSVRSNIYWSFAGLP
jgi:hypothetical protein